MLFNLILFSLLLIFLICLHPLQNTLALILFVLIILFNLSNYSTHWVCYLFALIYFGGVLILFTYISSIIPNFSPSSIALTMPILVGIIFTFTNNNSYWPILETFNPTELPLPFVSSTPSMFLLLFILSLVLLLLILSISILSNFNSPLRNI